MNIDFDAVRLKPIVTLEETEIKSAFESEENLRMLLHEITRKCYGDFIANICFPLNEVKE